ncbi:MAG: DUF1905 domain-containing protein [Candidatus Gracilibacteria bacterium]|nr:DUF1905 domain-containing protein [Candidatus Gracilibacteria bacterium]
MSTLFDFSAPLWRWSGGKASWYFITLGVENSALIRHIEGQFARGFGSIRVEVTIGDSTWHTSIFPSKEKRYILPVKALIRKQEGLVEGREVRVQLRAG